MHCVRAAFQVCQNNGWEILRLLLVFEYIFWDFRLGRYSQRLLGYPWSALCPKGGFLTPLWGPRVGLERSLGTCRAHCLTILWHFCCACSTWRAFAGVWGAIWRPKGLKVRSVRLAGCAETIVNSMVFAACHLPLHICVVLFARWVSR